MRRSYDPTGGADHRSAGSTIRSDSALRELGAEPALRGLGAEPALAVRVRAQRPQEVDAAEVRPVGVAEVELRVRRLPQQEAGQPLLPARTDDQVGIGLALGVEVLGDVVDVEDLGQLLDGAAGRARARAAATGTRR